MSATVAIMGMLLMAASSCLAAASEASSKEVASMAGGSRNLVPNASFEEAAGELPVGCTVHSPRPAIAPEFALDTRFARTGERSLLLSGAGKAGVVGWASIRCEGVQAGAMYEASAYFRAEGISDLHESVWARISWLRDAQDDMPYGALLHEITREGEWWRIAGRFRAPEGATLGEVWLSLRHAPDGKLWWDDVSLIQVPAPAPRRVRLGTIYLPQEQRTPEGWRRAIEEAGEAKVDALCVSELPELLSPETDPCPTIPGKATDYLAILARKYRMMIVTSLPEWQGELRYNTGVVIGRDGRLLGRYHKTHLPQSEVEEGTSPGSTFPVFETEIGRVGVLICYDHFFPEVARSLALNGAEIIFVPIMGDNRSNGTVVEAVARARAVDNGVFYVTSIRDPGRSMIVDPHGTVLADSAGKPGLVTADVDLDACFYERWLSVRGSADFNHLWRKERRPGIYRDLMRGP